MYKKPTVPEVDEALSIKDGKKKKRNDEKPKDKLKKEENKNLCIERLKTASIQEAVEQEDTTDDAEDNQVDFLKGT